MTQVEFTNRTQVEVSAKEYAAIEEVYMNSDLDKDAFCKMWVKMNKSRVEAARRQDLRPRLRLLAKRLRLTSISASPTSRSMRLLV